MFACCRLLYDDWLFDPRRDGGFIINVLYNTFGKRQTIFGNEPVGSVANKNRTRGGQKLERWESVTSG